MVTGMTGRIRGGNRRAVLASALMAIKIVTTALASALAVAPAQAQQQAVPMAATAQLRSERSFDIPAQPLTDALVAFGRQSGIQVTIDGTLARDVASPGVQGAMTSEQALRRLLAGSGLTYVVADETTVAIEGPGERDDGGPIRTGPVLVEGAVTDGRRSTAEDAAFTTLQSTAYISREQIERIQPTSPGDIFKETPGVLSAASNDGTSINVNIRSSQGLNRVRTMVEGTQQDNSGYQGYAGSDQRTYIDPELIGGVEITRGPGGGPYGTGTTSGIVNVRLLDAEDLIRGGRKTGFRLRGGVGGNAIAPRDFSMDIFRNPDLVDLAEDSNDVLTEDNWFGSFAGAYSTDRFDLVAAYARREEGNYFAGEHGTIRNTKIEPGQEVPNTSQDTRSILLKGTLRFGDGQSLEAGYTRYDSKFGQVFPTNVTIFTLQQYILNEVESDRYWLRYKWDSANPLIDLQANLWGTNAHELGEYRQIPQENDAWGAEVWNTSFFETGLGDLTVTAGAEYARSEAVFGFVVRPIDADDPVFRDLFPVIPPGFDLDCLGCTQLSETVYTPIQPPYTEIPVPQVTLGEYVPDFAGDRDVYGAYINASLTPTDWLTLTAGLRYDGFKSNSERAEGFNTIQVAQRDEARAAYNAALSAGDLAEADRLLSIVRNVRLFYEGAEGRALQSYEASDERLSPRAGVIVEPVDGLQLVAQYSEGFRALSHVELGKTFVDQVIVNPDLQDMEAEVVKTWEAGVNYLRDGLFFDDDAFRIRLSYFNNHYDNFIARTVQPIILDDGSRRSLFFYRNLDEEVTVAGYELSLFYDAGWGFADLNFNDFTELFEAPTQVKMEQAEYTGTLTVGTRWLDARLQLGSRLTFFGDLTIDPDADLFVYDEERYFWEANEIVDVFGSYQINDDLAVGFSVENVANTYYNPPLFVTLFPSPGRTARMNVTMAF